MLGEVGPQFCMKIVPNRKISQKTPARNAVIIFNFLAKMHTNHLYSALLNVDKHLLTNMLLEIIALMIYCIKV